MEMFRSFRGDKHEFCLAVIKFKHVRSCPSFDITYTLKLGAVIIRQSIIHFSSVDLFNSLVYQSNVSLWNSELQELRYIM